MYFSATEIFESVISALVLGSVFGIFCIFVSTLFDFLSSAFLSLRSLFTYEKIFERPSLLSPEKRERKSSIEGIITFLTTVVFGLLYILLSYYSLDGAIRVYMLLLFGGSYLGVFLPLSRYLKPYFLRALFALLILLVYFIRILIAPFRWFFACLCRISQKITKKAQKIQNKSNLTLDKRKK